MNGIPKGKKEKKGKRANLYRGCPWLVNIYMEVYNTHVFIYFCLEKVRVLGFTTNGNQIGFNETVSQ